MSRMRSRNIAAVILAGGIGKRVGKLKQFLPINGRPLMFYSIKAFIETPFIKKVIVVVPPSRKLYAQRLVGKYIQVIVDETKSRPTYIVEDTVNEK